MSGQESLIKKWLEHPKLRGLDLDDPATTYTRREVILENSFLRQIYESWYAGIISALPEGDGQVLELGSGGGFLNEHLPLITSELIFCSYVKAIIDARSLPFADESLRGIVMTNVFHHIADVRLFFHEAARCVRPGGIITMVEPWVSPWSRFVYGRWHHEYFDPEADGWHFPPGGPLSSSNGALLWIVFSRDLTVFQREFPMWDVVNVRPMMPLLYLLSGGVSMRQLMPGWTFDLWNMIEKPLDRNFGMFAQVTIKKLPGNANPK